MGRREKPLDPAAGPVQRFAHDLRELRCASGSPTYREMARHCDYSAPTLSGAAAGERLPSLPVALAYVTACGAGPDGWEERWRAASAELAEQPTGPDDDPATAPYPGLARYGPEDHAHFFGRDELVADLLELTARRPFAAVVGASGSGKSSLLRAGLVPALRSVPAEQAGPRPSVIRILTPGQWPARAHKDLLTEGALVVLDQFEEVFTLCHDAAERSDFIGLLLDSGARVVIAIRADFYGRCAEHPGLAAALKDATLLVGPMTPPQLRAAVVGPATAQRLIVERSLTARVVADVADEPGGLPLMSHALLEVWRRRRGRTLTESAYEAIGGVQGAIAHTAEAVYAELSNPEARAARALLLRLISPGDGTPDTRRPVEHSELVASARAGRVLERLVGARLLIADDAAVNLAHEALITAWPRLRTWVEEDRDRLRLHRRLTETARVWEDLNRDAGALLRGVQLAAAREAFGAEDATDTGHAPGCAGGVRRRSAVEAGSGRAPARAGAIRRVITTAAHRACLAAGNRTAPNEDTASGAKHGAGRGPEDELTSSERDFLHASLAAQARTQRAAARTTRRLRMLTIALSVLLCLAAVAGLSAWQQGRVSDRRAAEAEARRIAGVADTLRSSDPRTAMRLALAAWRVAELPETRAALFGAAAQRELDSFAAPPMVAYENLAEDRNDTWRRLDRTGRTLTKTGPDRVERWDLATRRRLPPYPGLGRMATAVQDISPDGRTAAVGTGDGLRLWDLAKGRLTGRPFAGSDAIEGTFGPGGRTFIARRRTEADDGFAAVQVWDTAQARLLLDIPVPQHGARHAEVGPDDRLFAYCPQTGPLQVWDISTRRRLPVDWPGSTDEDLCIDSTWDFTPDGRGIFHPAESGIRIRDVRTGRERPGVPVPSAWDVAFSDDGTYMATASEDAVQLWRTADPSAPVLRHPVTGVGLSDLRLDLAAGVLRYQEGSDPAAAVQTLSLDGAVPRRWQQRPYTAARFTSDGATLATVTARRVQVRDGGSGELRSTLPESVCDDCPPLLSFSSDGTALAHLTGRDRESATATVRRLTAPGRAVTVGKGVNGVAFTADDRSVVLTQSVTETDRWTLDGRSRTAVRRARDGEALAMSPEGHVLTTDRQLIDVASGRARRVMTGEGLAVAAVFSADGRFLAMGDMDGRVTLWNGTGQRRLAVLVPGSSSGRDPRRPAPAIAFSSDGNTVAVGGPDGSLRLWRTGSPTGPSAPLASVDGPVLAVAFAEHDTRLRVTTPHVGVHAYDLDPRSTAEAVCRRAGGGLSRAAWGRYLPTVPYRATC